MNKVVHEQSRLRILTLLASSPAPVSFTVIRDSLAMTGGNLSIQLKTLEDSQYVSIEKSFAENKSRTDISITDEGQKALIDHLEELESLLAGLRAGKGAGK